MATALIMEKVQTLRGLLDPTWIDGCPGCPGPIYRTPIANYVVAEILRDISKNLNDREAARQLGDIGKELVSEASQGLVKGWEDGDDICPPWRHVGPPPPRVQPKTGPAGPDFPPTQVFETWAENLTPVVNDVVLAVAIRRLASLTTSEKASTTMKGIGEAIVKSSATKLFDDYCGTKVRPHVPPKPKTVAA